MTQNRETAGATSAFWPTELSSNTFGLFWATKLGAICVTAIESSINTDIGSTVSVHRSPLPSLINELHVFSDCGIS